MVEVIGSIPILPTKKALSIEERAFLFAWGTGWGTEGLLWLFKRPHAFKAMIYD